MKKYKFNSEEITIKIKKIRELQKENNIKKVSLAEGELLKSLTYYVNSKIFYTVKLKLNYHLFQGHCQAYEFSSDNCDVNESKFPWSESTNNDHVSHYSKTAAPFSAARTINNSYDVYSVLLMTLASIFLLQIKLY